LALPHGEAAAIARELLAAGVKVLDLSADFRLKSIDEHKKWYGEHHAPELASEARYGLVERHRASLKGARLIAVPGCYPTATLLALAPLLDAKAIEPRDLIVDAKSGVSGAGRGLSRSSLFCEAAGGVKAYKVAEHRHTPEIEQELSRAHGAPITITFTPHLIPMVRGIVSTCYALPTAKRARPAYLDLLRAAYENEPFVTVVDHPPDSAHLAGSNRVHVSAFVDERSGRVIAIGAIDNLVKGAAGQAVQALNAQMGWPETDGLGAVGVFP
jgi:N-acetyl-gamma-glutamyl-phosphate reductase